MKVLILQLTRMGDIIQTVPLLARLREEHPQVEITMVCVSAFADILRATPLVHRYVKLTPREAVVLRQHTDDVIVSLLAHPFLRETYDLLVNLTHDAHSGLIASRITAAVKTGLADHHIGRLAVHDPWGRYLFAAVGHRVENSFNLVDIHLGMGLTTPQPVEGYLRCDERSERRARHIFATFGIRGGQPVVAMHMGANRPHRTWPVERFIHLARQLISSYGVSIVLTGSSSERELAEEFLRSSHHLGFSHDKVLNLVGQTTIQDLIAILRRCNVLVSNDTGPIHIAAAVGTPTVGIYLSTAYPGETAPYGAGHHVIHPVIPCYPCMDVSECANDLRCRTSISEEVIFKAVSDAITKEFHPAPHRGDALRLRSRFLANGTLFYEPLTPVGIMPPHLAATWLRKVVVRILWEGAFSLDLDPTILSIPRREDLFAYVDHARQVLDRVVKTAQVSRDLTYVSGILEEFAHQHHREGTPLSRNERTLLAAMTARLERLGV